MYELDEDIFEDQIGPDNLSLFYFLKYYLNREVYKEIKVAPQLTLWWAEQLP